MGFGESLKSILLFSLKKGYRDVHFEAGKLPFVANSAGERATINGIRPIEQASIDNIRRLFMDNANSTITRILGYDFMLVSLGSKIVFRHLPRISRPLNFGPKLERACLCKKGAIIHIDEDLAERTLNAYRYAALTLSLQRLSIAIVETNKFYRLESYRNIVTDVFRPDLELSIAVRMSEQAGFNCIMVPDCSDIDTANILNYIASERLVIAGVNPKVANYFKAEHINHGTKPRPRGAVMYNEAIIKKIEVEHA